MSDVRVGDAKVDAEYMPLGALVRGDTTLFRVWSPRAERLDVQLPDESIEMNPVGGGYFEASAHAPSGTTYRIRLDGGDEFPDPASRFQPEGIHGPSQVVDPSSFNWTNDTWTGLPREALVFYELHTGTFSAEGTFEGVRMRLPYLKDLGITAIELMPVSDFPGRWNWGYDHAALYAPSRAYGDPDDLRRLVDDAHEHGLAVYLDVIYNHLGPDGAYVAAFAPMFTDKHHTPWGMAINLDDEHSAGVRSFFIDNARHWLSEYRLDGLRLDATHALVDNSRTHFLAELDLAVETIEGPRRFLFAEDARNLNTIILPREEGGYGLDGVWTDDYHHLVRHIAAGDSDGYFEDFVGLGVDDLAATIEKGWYFEGQRTTSSGKRRGTDASIIKPDQCVICIQNHDQIGNRPYGNRLNHDVPLPIFHALSALTLFVPELPLLFMGQEWAATTPFQFFTDHDEELGRLVTEGRKKEFEGFLGFGGDVPDPQDPRTFQRSRLKWDELNDGLHRGTLNLYRDMLAVRKKLNRGAEAVSRNGNGLAVRRGSYELLVALGGGAVLPASSDAQIILRTDDEKYTSDGVGLDRTRDEIRFSRAGAVLTLSADHGRDL